MELKQDTTFLDSHLLKLLIVPYGIETSYRICYCRQLGLLIVTYGIETPHILIG